MQVIFNSIVVVALNQTCSPLLLYKKEDIVKKLYRLTIRGAYKDLMRVLSFVSILGAHSSHIESVGMRGMRNIATATPRHTFNVRYVSS